MSRYLGNAQDYIRFCTHSDYYKADDGTPGQRYRAVVAVIHAYEAA